VARQRLGEVAHVFAGVSRYGRTVLLAPASVADRRRRKQSVEEVRLLRLSAVTDQGLNLNDCEPVFVTDRNDLKAYTLRAGDVVLTGRSTTLRVCLAPVEATGMPISGHLLAVRPMPDRLDGRLLMAFLRHPRGEAALLQRSGTSTAQLNVTVRALQELAIPLPPLDRQRLLADLIQAADEQCRAAIAAADKGYAIALQIVMDQLGG
jgi:hypothetical protein